MDLKQSAEMRAAIMAQVEQGGTSFAVLRHLFPSVADNTVRGVVSAMVRNKILINQDGVYVKGVKTEAKPKNPKGKRLLDAGTTKTEVRVEDNRIIIEHPKARVIVELK